METLLEDNKEQYKDEFVGAETRLREVQSSGKVKSAHSQISKLLQILTGIVQPSTATVKPAVSSALPDLEILASEDKKSSGDLLNDVPAREEQKSKLNAFTFMQNNPKPGNEGLSKPGLFANMQMKPAIPTTNGNHNGAAKSASSFSFMGKSTATQKKESSPSSGLQDLDLNFDIPSKEVKPILDLYEISGGQEKKTGGMFQPELFTQIKPMKGIIPPPLYSKEGLSKNESNGDDKYFDFVSKHLEDVLK